MKHDQGQALIETTLFVLAVSVLLAGFWSFTKWFAIRQKLLLAAKHGAVLYSSGRWTRAEAESEMRAYLVRGAPPLEPGGIRVHVGPVQGARAWMHEWDESVAAYMPMHGWHPLVGAQASISERFVVKHAPRYWAPLQPWGGPAVRYGA